MGDLNVIQSDGNLSQKERLSEMLKAWLDKTLCEQGLNKPRGKVEGFMKAHPAIYTLAHLECITMATLHHIQLLACKPLVAMVIYSKLCNR